MGRCSTESLPQHASLKRRRAFFVSQNIACGGGGLGANLRHQAMCVEQF
jgi:hypothetical protein